MRREGARRVKAAHLKLKAFKNYSNYKKSDTNKVDVVCTITKLMDAMNERHQDLCGSLCVRAYVCVIV